MNDNAIAFKILTFKISAELVHSSFQNSWYPGVNQNVVTSRHAIFEKN